MTNDQLKALIKKNPVTVACGVVVLAVLGGLYFRSGDIATAEAELAEKSAASEKYSLNITYSAQLKEQHDALATANKAIESRLTRASQRGVNTQYFYQLERETGVKLVSFTQSATPAKPAKSAFMPIGFSVAVQGTLAQTIDFLRQLEDGAHYCRVHTANFSINPTSRGGPLTLSLTLELLGLP